MTCIEHMMCSLRGVLKVLKESKQRGAPPFSPVAVLYNARVNRCSGSAHLPETGRATIPCT